MRRLLLLALPVVLSGALATSPAWAGTQPARRPAPADEAAAEGDKAVARAGKVDLRVMVVYATEQHSNVDPRLEKLTRFLSHLRFTGYELLDSYNIPLAPRSSETFEITDNRKVTVELLSKDDQRVRMRVQITAGKGGKLLDTTLSVNRNGTFIVAGPRYKDGVLVLPLTARY